MVFVVLVAAIASGVFGAVCTHALGGSVAQVMAGYPLGGVLGVVAVAMSGEARRDPAVAAP